ncbi:MAG: glycosyltransferase family 2 protein [Sphingobacteriales bacterium]|nr:MAG: glycosyltransferase family 2 protein [Sphingobacteriales bacterium]
MGTVSAVIITFNEEDNLDNCLSRLTWCDEIVVVDCGSTDNTLAICRNYNCTVHYRKFDGYGPQKQFAVNCARNEWVLCLDADEVLTHSAIKEIQQVLRNPDPDVTGYLLPISLVFMGQQFRYGKECKRYFLRLFNKKAGNFNDRSVHEGVKLQGKTVKLKHKVLHYSYRCIHHYMEKLNKYSTYGSELYYKSTRKKSVFSVIMAVPLNFLKYFFVEGNFLNGEKGFYWSVLNSVYHFVKYIKLRELYYLQNDKAGTIRIPVKGVNDKNESLPPALKKRERLPETA